MSIYITAKKVSNMFSEDAGIFLITKDNIQGASIIM